MRILLCSYSSSYGGMERRLKEEAAILIGLGHEVLYCAANFPGSQEWHARMDATGARPFLWNPYKFVERRQFWPPFQWAAMASGRSLKRANVDLAHIAVPYGYVGMSMACVLRSAGVGYVLAVHTKPSDRPLGVRGARAVRRGLEGMIAMYAVSEPALHSFLDLYAGQLPQDRPMRVIQNGIALNQFHQDPIARDEVRRELSFGADDLVVVFCGRLDAQKQPLIALQAFACLSERLQSARLLVMGEGPARAELEAEADRLHLRESVRLVGWVENPARYYAASDCYLSTSNHQEGFSLTAAEALATGLVAVLPSDDMFNSIYGRAAAARFANPNDLSQIVDALHDLLSLESNERWALGKAGRDFVEQNLSFETMRRNLKAFYADVEKGLR